MEKGKNSRKKRLIVRANFRKMAKQRDDYHPILPQIDFSCNPRAIPACTPPCKKLMLSKLGMTICELRASINTEISSKPYVGNTRDSLTFKADLPTKLMIMQNLVNEG
jgi:hypothetical protein